MTPTNRLRFVEREVPMHPFYRTVGPDGEMRQAVQTYRVLQQWWEPDSGDLAGAGPEWRDVPLEKAE